MLLVSVALCSHIGLAVAGRGGAGTSATQSARRLKEIRLFKPKPPTLTDDNWWGGKLPETMKETCPEKSATRCGRSETKLLVAK
jgi:hypothetical protein